MLGTIPAPASHKLVVAGGGNRIGTPERQFEDLQVAIEQAGVTGPGQGKTGEDMRDRSGI